MLPQIFPDINYYIVVNINYFKCMLKLKSNILFENYKVTGSSIMSENLFLQYFSSKNDNAILIIKR